MQGGLFTWKGGPNNGRMARLDRFLITEEWDCQFGKVTQRILPRPISDHSPILLKGTWLNGPYTDPVNVVPLSMRICHLVKKTQCSYHPP